MKNELWLKKLKLVLVHNKVKAGKSDGAPRVHLLLQLQLLEDVPGASDAQRTSNGIVELKAKRSPSSSAIVQGEGILAWEHRCRAWDLRKA